MVSLPYVTESGKFPFSSRQHDCNLMLVHCRGTYDKIHHLKSIVVAYEHFEECYSKIVWLVCDAENDELSLWTLVGG